MWLPLRVKLTGMTMVAASLLSGCIPMPRERPGYVDLCQTDYKFNLAGTDGKSSIVLETYLYDHRIPGLLMSEKRGHFTFPYEQEGDDRPEFYLQLIAYNQGRERPSRPGSKGQKAIPIIYDSRQAYLDLGNGTRLNARPDLFLGTDSFPYDFPGQMTKYMRPSPYDINSDEVHRRVPRISNNDDYGSVYVVFKTWNADLSDRWTVHLGELTVAGQKIALPPLKLCYQPAKTWIGIEPLMRP